MKKVMTMVVALFVALALANSAFAQDDWAWRKLGMSPYAKSRSAAMKTRESAFKKLGLPQPVIEKLKIATKKGGDQVILGGTLDAMIMKKGVVKKNVRIEIPKGVHAEAWGVSWEGKTYRVYLPQACNNWAYAVIAEAPGVQKPAAPAQAQSAPTTAAPTGAPVPSGECGKIRFTTKAGEPAIRIAFVGSGGVLSQCAGKLKECVAKDACLAKNSFQECSSESGLCDFSDTGKALGLKVQSTASLPLSPGEHVIYVPKAFMTEGTDDMACLVLLRGADPSPMSGSYDPKAAISHNKEVFRWKKTQYSDAICVGYYGYSKGVATVYHSKGEMPSGTKIEMYFPEVGKTLFN